MDSLDRRYFPRNPKSLKQLARDVIFNKLDSLAFADKPKHDLKLHKDFKVGELLEVDGEYQNVSKRGRGWDVFQVVYQAIDDANKYAESPDAGFLSSQLWLYVLGEFLQEALEWGVKNNDMHLMLCYSIARYDLGIRWVQPKKIIKDVCPLLYELLEICIDGKAVNTDRLKFMTYPKKQWFSTFYFVTQPGQEALWAIGGATSLRRVREVLPKLDIQYAYDPSEWGVYVHNHKEVLKDPSFALSTYDSYKNDCSYNPPEKSIVVDDVLTKEILDSALGVDTGNLDQEILADWAIGRLKRFYNDKIYETKFHYEEPAFWIFSIISRLTRRQIQDFGTHPKDAEQSLVVKINRDPQRDWILSRSGWGLLYDLDDAYISGRSKPSIK